MSQPLGLLVVVAGVGIAIAAGSAVVRFRRLDVVWGLGAAVTIFPAILATLLALGATSCAIGGCITGSEKDLLKLSIPALPVLAVALLLGFYGLHLPSKVGILLAQAMTAIAIWKSSSAGTVVLAIVAVGEIAYELVRNLGAVGVRQPTADEPPAGI